MVTGKENRDGDGGGAEKKPANAGARGRLRLVCLALISISLGLTIGLALIEVCLHFLPVRDIMASPEPITAERPLRRDLLNGEFTYSKGWDFSIVNTVHTNNYGYVNDNAYDPAQTSPLLAVIGDSYIEAMVVPYAKTIHGRLAAYLKGARVYSFGFAGDPLSQYIAQARFVRKEFSPDAMVFVVVGNDFDESMLEYKNAPGFHYFVEDGKGGYALQLVEYYPVHPSVLHSIGHALGLQKLALVRYVRTNYEVTLGQLYAALASKHEKYAGQTLANVDNRRERLGKMAIEAFFRMLPEATGLPPEKILFVVDGIRPQLYDGGDMGRGSYFDLMRRRFIARAEQGGYGVADMQKVFAEDFRRNGKRFEFPTDGHWNGRGHRLAFEAAAESPVVAAFPHGVMPSPVD